VLFPGPVRLAFVLLAGAALGLARAEDLPALNSPATTESLPGKFVWADLFTSNPAAARTFYTGLFGWTSRAIERNGHPYYVLSNGDRPIAGIAPLTLRFKAASQGRWVRFVSVPDVPRTVQLVTAAGGHIIFPAREIPQRGSQAVLSDQEGALIGVLHSSSGDPGDYQAEPGDWVWEELFSANPTAASQYYRSLFSYQIEPDGRVNRQDAFIIASEGYARASLVPLPARRGAYPAWLSFVRVSNLDTAIAQAVALGGHVLAQPKPPHPDSRMAILADPLGAAIGIVELFDEPAAGAAP
jgi:predicted enzyme related to lactoylglutathione lyase